MRNRLRTVERKGRVPYLRDNRLLYFRPFLRTRICASVRTISPDRSRVRSVSVRVKMVYSTYKKQRILYLYSQGYRPPTIKKMLDKENLKCSRVGIYKFLKSYIATRSISGRVGSGRPSKVTAEIKQLVEQQMRIDDETTAYQLHRMLTEKGYSISLRTILRCRTVLGWTFRGSAYCQLIRQANKQKRLQWAQQHLGQSFEDVIWTDESTIQMESHHRFACRKGGEAPRPKPR